MAVKTVSIATPGFLPWWLLHLLACAGSTIIDAGRGPVEIRLPEGYHHTKSYPLVFLLPGYGTGAAGFYEQVHSMYSCMVDMDIS